MSSDYYGALAGEIADEGAGTWPASRTACPECGCEPWLPSRCGCTDPDCACSEEGNDGDDD